MEDPEPGGNILIVLIILILLTLLNGLFSMAEIAIVTLKNSTLKKSASSGNKRAKLLQKLLSDPSSFFATIQVGVTISGFMASAVAADAFVKRLSGVLGKTMIPETMVRGISVVLITFVLSYFTLVFGELLPKTIAIQKHESIAFAAARPLVFVAFIARPAVKLLSLTTNFFLKIFGLPNKSNEVAVTEEEIRILVDESEEAGGIEESQKDMINNIFEFDDITVGEIMTHRIDVTAVEYDQTLNDVIKVAIEEGYSRIPVYKDDLDSILGIIYVKDLLKYVGKSGIENLKITDIMRPAFFVPESKRLVELFTEFTAKKVQMAVVCDEYGGTQGIVTMEDLLEFIVGNIQDEYDDEQEEISQLDENTFTVDGTTDIDEVADLLEVELPEGDYDTIGGMLLDMLGYIPQQGENPSVEVQNFTFTVLSVEDRRIDKIKIVKNEIDDSDLEPANEE